MSLWDSDDAGGIKRCGIFCARGICRLGHSGLDEFSLQICRCGNFRSGAVWDLMKYLETEKILV